MSGNSFLRLGRGRRWTESDLAQVVASGLAAPSKRDARRQKIAALAADKATQDRRPFGGFSFRLPWVPSVNGAYVARKDGQGRAKVKAAKEFAEAGSKMLLIQGVPASRISHPLSITIIQHASSGVGDCDNGIKLVPDLLVSYGVIADDNRNIVKKISAEDGERADPPYIEVTIASILTRN